MIERRNRQFTRRSRPLSLAMPVNTRLEQTSGSAGAQTGLLARRSQVAAAETRTDVKSLEQRQRVTVFCLMVLLWILFFVAGIILWERASSG